MGVAVFLPGMIGQAHAITCPNGANSFFNCNSVCETDPSGSPVTFICNVSGSTSSAHATMVEDYSTSSAYEAWGDVSGVDFCCVSDSNAVPTFFEILGSGESDTLGFSFQSRTYNLKPHNGVAITAYAYAGEGDDTIYGSDYADADYVEYLHGEDGNDTIRAYAGADYLYGEADEDLLLCGEGNDHALGGDDNDDIGGGDGDDDLRGEAGQDRVKGDGGDDTIDGGTEGDILCGNGEVGGDTLIDGPGDNPNPVDILYASVAADFDYCYSTGTKWDAAAGTGGCDDGHPVQTTAPTFCTSGP